MLVVFGLRGFAFAQRPASGPVDPVELGIFMDGLMEGQMEAYHFAGAAVEESGWPKVSRTLDSDFT